MASRIAKHLFAFAGVLDRNGRDNTAALGDGLTNALCLCRVARVYITKLIYNKSLCRGIQLNRTPKIALRDVDHRTAHRLGSLTLALDIGSIFVRLAAHRLLALYLDISERRRRSR